MTKIGSQIEAAADGGDPRAVVQELLKSAGYRAARVRDYFRLGGGNPVMSQVFRVRISDGDRDTSTVVLKIPAKSRNDRIREAATGSYQREAEVYRLLRDMQGGFQPRILAELYDAEASISALLIEDLGRLPTRNEFTVNVVADTLSGLANIHARFWGDEALGANSWMRDGRRADIFNEDTERFTPNWEVLRSSPVLHPCDEPNVDAVGSFLSGHLIEVLDALDARPYTLIHGDLHTANMMLRRNGTAPDPVLIDWQDAVFSGASSDVAKFLSTTLSPECASTHFEDLIGHYHRSLSSEIPTDYPFPAFRRDVMLALLGTFANYVICATTDISGDIEAASVNKSLRSVCAVINVVQPLDAL